MEELNTTKDVATVTEDGFDTLTTVNLGASFSLAQVDEDGDLHNVIIGPDQAEALIGQLKAFLG